jgi:hypothetical protein
MSSYDGYRLLHFGQNDEIVVVGAIHSKLVVGYVDGSEGQTE